MRPPKWMTIDLGESNGTHVSATVTIRRRSVAWLRFLNAECLRLRPDLSRLFRWRTVLGIWLRGHS